MSLLLLFMTLTKCNKASNVRRCVTISTGMQVTFTRVGLSPRSGSGGESSHSTFKIFFSPSCVAHLWIRCGNADPLVKRSSTCKCSTENRNTYLDGHISWSTCFYLNISVRWYHRWCVEWVWNFLWHSIDCVYTDGRLRHRPTRDWYSWTHWREATP